MNAGAILFGILNAIILFGGLGWCLWIAFKSDNSGDDNTEMFDK